MTASLYSTKKAQIKIIETILVLFIFLIILILGIYFYYQYSFSSIRKESFEISEKQATALLSSITNIQELSCTNENDCIDIIKLINFKSIYSQNKAYYSKLFKYKKIIIEQIYPEVQENSCTFQNTFPLNCNSITIHESKPKTYTSKSIISMPINIYYPNFNKYSLAKVIIEVYK